jgi:DNA-binding response OmpR family regulator
MARLLVVEDELRISRFVERALSAQGFEVEVAGTGPQGLARSLGEQFDLVILDLMLPGMNGADLLEQLLLHRPQQRVLVLSAVPDVGTRVRVLDMGALDFLPKPFAVAELIARVRARLRVDAAPVGAAPEMLEVGDLHLDLRRHTLIDGDRNIALSQREYMLLCHLMQRAGRVCTREELLADVWGYTFDPGSNVVDVYVRRLRSKLDAQRIETVRNVGYCLLAS